MRFSMRGLIAAELAVAMAGCSSTVDGPTAAGDTPPSLAMDPLGVAEDPAGVNDVAQAPVSTDPVPVAVPATDPGRVTLHRLNRAEYNNTVRDLLGTQLTPADTFPIDDRGSGLDNLADVLSLSPLHLSTYNRAAQTLVAEALANPAQRAELVPCDLVTAGDACLRSVLEAIVPRAWRRPTTPAEIDALVAVAQTALGQGDSHEVGLTLALRSMLLSPHFIFRVEIDPDPVSLEPHPLNGYEAASRLSYFLWSSMPDDELFSRAESGRLLDPAELSAQVTRMLQSPKASALVDNFAGQWLALRAADAVAPTPTVYPSFDAELRDAMRAESELLFREIVFNGLPVNQLLTANFTFVNDRLAAHYGLPLPGTTELTRVSLADHPERIGFLSHASFLTINSRPQRTSPVLRGRWVLDELLCSKVPDPPPDVNLASIDEGVGQGLPQREVLAQHRADPRCSACHSLMDPIGLGLENFDGIGAYRTTDDGAPIDSAGQLPTGEPFTGSAELATLIAGRPEFARCVTQKLYSYALGRNPERVDGHLDRDTLAHLESRLMESGYSFGELVSELVLSPTFLNRRGEAAEGVSP
jgi:hypothetical protein